MNKKFAIAFTAAALVMGASASSAFAATDVTVSNNGAFSGSSVKVSNSNATYVGQSNSSVVVNTVTSSANSGGNKSNFNVGGVSYVSTGKATSNVGIVVGGSTNTATVETCDCDEDVTVDVKGNGAFSHNKVKVSNKNWFKSFQANVTNVFNGVNSKAKTGDNSSNFNVGDSVVESGASNSTVVVEVEGSSNTLN